MPRESYKNYMILKIIQKIFSAIQKPSVSFSKFNNVGVSSRSSQRPPKRKNHILRKKDQSSIKGLVHIS